MNKSLDQLEAGDEVVYYPGYSAMGDSIIQIATINRVTKTQIIINNHKFRKSNGSCVEKYTGFGGGPRIEAIKNDEQRDKILQNTRRHKIIQRLKKTDWDTWDSKDLEKVMATVLEVQPKTTNTNS